MTYEVISNLTKYSISPVHIIHVSDRSDLPHIHSLQNALHDVQFLETNQIRFGLGAAMNIGLEEAFKYTDNVLLIENDMLLHRNIDFTKYFHVLNYSEIGFISFKFINELTNVNVKDFYFDNHKYLIREKIINDNFSYVIDIGCFMISKRFYNYFGKFIENVRPCIVEQTFVNKYIENECKLIENRVLAVNDSEYLYSKLNDVCCLFYHIGTDSINKTTVNCPKQYVYLSKQLTNFNFYSRYL